MIIASLNDWRIDLIMFESLIDRALEESFLVIFSYSLGKDGYI